MCRDLERESGVDERESGREMLFLRREGKGGKSECEEERKFS